MLRILSADLIETGIGNFASPKVRKELDPLLEGVELLVLDNSPASRASSATMTQRVGTHYKNGSSGCGVVAFQS